MTSALNGIRPYQSALKCTKRTRLVEFQFKFLHRQISTNDFLTKIGIKDNPDCSFCNKELEKLTHLFWSCSKVTTFWNSLIQQLTLSQIIPQNYKINISTGFALTPDASKSHNQINFCLSLARHYIWICKNKKAPPSIQDFLHYLKSTFLLELKPGDGPSKNWELLQTLFWKILVCWCCSIRYLSRSPA